MSELARAMADPDATDRLVEILVRALRSGVQLVSAEQSCDAPMVTYGGRVIGRELRSSTVRGTLHTFDGFVITFEHEEGR